MLERATLKLLPIYKESYCGFTLCQLTLKQFESKAVLEARRQILWKEEKQTALARLELAIS